MRRAGSLFLIIIAAASTLFAQRAGDLDSTFGVGGVVVTPFTLGDDYEYSATVQTDGKIVVVGEGSESYDFLVVRYNSNGTPDSSFGSGGKVTTDFSLWSGWGGSASAVAMQPDGKIVVAGVTSLPDTSSDFAIARYNTDGSLDTTFGVRGKVTTNFSEHDHVNSVALQPDGKIIAAGGSDTNFCVVRYTSNGTLDSSFGIGGKVITFVNWEYIRAVVITLDGRIIVGGGEANFHLVCYHNDGSIDSSFGSFGMVTTAFHAIYGSSLHSMALQPDGKVLAAGESVYWADVVATLVRYNSDGTLDTTFGIDGIVRTSRDDGTDIINSIALQDDLKIIAIGDGFNNGFALMRYNTDGTLDSTFSIDGKSSTAIGNSWARANTVVLQPDGKIIGVGDTDGNDRFDTDFTLLRCLASDLNVGIVEFSESPNNVLIYPNPIGAEATLEYSLTQPETLTIRLLDMQGRAVKTFIENTLQDAGNHRQAIALPATLPAGSYLIVLESQRGKMSVKVMK